MAVEFNESFNKFVQWANGVEVSEDKNTAVLTVSIDKDLVSTRAKYNEFKFGRANITQKVYIDLSKAKPFVTDVKFAQTFTPYEIKTNPDVGPAPEEYLS